MRRHLSRLRLIALGGLLVLVALPLWCSRTPPPLVQVAEATRSPLQVKVATNGEVEPLEEAELVVRARLDGRVLFLPEPGARVGAGDELLRIDDAPVAAALAKAQSDRLAALEDLRAARHELTVLRERFATDERLHEQGALTRDRFVESRAALQDAEARIAALEREVPLRVSSLELGAKELRANLDAAAVKAAFAGTVYRTAVKKGEMVRAGDPILWVADLERLRVRTNIDQADLGRVQQGHKVLIGTNAFPGRVWTGQITEVVPHVVVKENRSVSEGLARLDPPTDGLVPGMRVDVEIIVVENPDALQVPAEAVFANGKRPFVYRVENGRLEKTHVEVGLSSVAAVEIRSGLAAGDLVVAGPAVGLADGVKVTLQSPSLEHSR